MTPHAPPNPAAPSSTPPAVLDEAFRLDEAFARALDAADPLRGYRDLFHLPPASAARHPGEALAAAGDGRSGDEPRAVYLVGNSLGCQPKAVAGAMAEALDDWRVLGVEGHLHGRHPWLPYHEELRDMTARLVGATPREVVVMNSLTVNLHLLMLSFYRPTPARFKIIIEDSAFPSDRYAVASQARLHGLDPATAVIGLRPRAGEHTLRTDDVLAAIDRERDGLALVMLGGVNYLTGQWFDMASITAAGHAAGAMVGWDLAHAAGNVPLNLHEAGGGPDFAAWCSYKFLNAGPGAVAGAFVHERHLGRGDLPQAAGWWGNDPATRFAMGPAFVPVASADRWQLSNPPIFAMTPLRVSLEIFDRATMPALRQKALRLTGYLERLIDGLPPAPGGGPAVRSLTPRDPAQRGSALSLVFDDRAFVFDRADGSGPLRGARAALAALNARGVMCDFREPNVIRAAPVPLYNTFHDVWRFVEIIRGVMRHEHDQGRGPGGA